MPKNSRLLSGLALVLSAALVLPDLSAATTVLTQEGRWMAAPATPQSPYFAQQALMLAPLTIKSRVLTRFRLRVFWGPLNQETARWYLGERESLLRKAALSLPSAELEQRHGTTLPAEELLRRARGLLGSVTDLEPAERIRLSDPAVRQTEFVALTHQALETWNAQSKPKSGEARRREEIDRRGALNALWRDAAKRWPEGPIKRVGRDGIEAAIEKAFRETQARAAAQHRALLRSGLNNLKAEAQFRLGAERALAKARYPQRAKEEAHRLAGQAAQIKDAALLTDLAPLLLREPIFLTAQAILGRINTLRQGAGKAYKDRRIADVRHFREQIAAESQRLAEILAPLAGNRLGDDFGPSGVDALLQSDATHNPFAAFGADELLIPIAPERLVAAALSFERLEAVEPGLRERFRFEHSVLGLAEAPSQDAGTRRAIAIHYAQERIASAGVTPVQARVWLDSPRYRQADAHALLEKLLAPPSEAPADRPDSASSLQKQKGHVRSLHPLIQRGAGVGLVAIIAFGLALTAWKWLHSSRAPTDWAQLNSLAQESGQVESGPGPSLEQKLQELEKSSDPVVREKVARIRHLMERASKEHQNKDGLTPLHANSDRWSPALAAPSATDIILTFEKPVSGFLRTGFYREFKNGQWIRKHPDAAKMKPAKAYPADVEIVNRGSFLASDIDMPLPVEGGHSVVPASVHASAPFEVLWDPRDGVFYIHFNMNKLKEPVYVSYGYTRGSDDSWRSREPTPEELAPMMPEDDVLMDDTEKAIAAAKDMRQRSGMIDPDEAAGMSLVEFTRSIGEYALFDEADKAYPYQPGAHTVRDIDRARRTMPDGSKRVLMACNVSATHNPAIERRAGLAANVEVGYRVLGNSRTVYAKEAHAISNFYSRQKGWIRADATPEDRFSDGVERQVYGASNHEIEEISQAYRDALEAAWRAAHEEKGAPVATQADAADPAAQDRSPWDEIRWIDRLGQSLAEDVDAIDRLAQTDPNRLVSYLLDPVSGRLVQRRAEWGRSQAPAGLCLRYEISLVQRALEKGATLSGRDKASLTSAFAALERNWLSTPVSLTPAMLYVAGSGSAPGIRHWDTSLPLPFPVSEREQAGASAASMFVAPKATPVDEAAPTRPVERDGRLLGFESKHQFYDPQGRPLLFPPLRVKTVKAIFGEHFRSDIYALVQEEDGAPTKLVDGLTGYPVPLPAEVAEVETLVFGDGEWYYLGHAANGDPLMGALGQATVARRFSKGTEVHLVPSRLGPQLIYKGPGSSLAVAPASRPYLPDWLPDNLKQASPQNVRFHWDYLNSSDRILNVVISKEPGQEGIFSRYDGHRLTPSGYDDFGTPVKHVRSFYFTARHKSGPRAGTYELFELVPLEDGAQVISLGSAPGHLCLEQITDQFIYVSQNQGQTFVEIHNAKGSYKRRFGPYAGVDWEALLAHHGVEFVATEADGRREFHEIVYTSHDNLKTYDYFDEKSTDAQSTGTTGRTSFGATSVGLERFAGAWHWRRDGSSGTKPALDTASVGRMPGSGVYIAISPDQTFETILFWDGRRLRRAVPADHHVWVIGAAGTVVYWRGTTATSQTYRLWRSDSAEPISGKESVDSAILSPIGKLYYLAANSSGFGADGFELRAEGIKEPLVTVATSGSVFEAPSLHLGANGVPYLYVSGPADASDNRARWWVNGLTGKPVTPANDPTVQVEYKLDVAGSGTYVTIQRTGESRRLLRLEDGWTSPAGVSVTGSPVIAPDGTLYYQVEVSNDRRELRRSDGVAVPLPDSDGSVAGVWLSGDGDIYYAYLARNYLLPEKLIRVSDQRVVWEGDHFTAVRVNGRHLELIFGSPRLPVLLQGGLSAQSPSPSFYPSSGLDISPWNEDAAPRAVGAYLTSLAGLNGSSLVLIDPDRDLDRSVDALLEMRVATPEIEKGQYWNEARSKLVQRLLQSSGAHRPAAVRVQLALLTMGSPEHEQFVRGLIALKNPDEREKARAELARLREVAFAAFARSNPKAFAPAGQGTPWLGEWFNRDLEEKASNDPGWRLGAPTSRTLADLNAVIRSLTQQAPWLVSPASQDIAMHPGEFLLRYGEETARNTVFVFLGLELFGLLLLKVTDKRRAATIGQVADLIRRRFAETVDSDVFPPTIPDDLTLSPERVLETVDEGQRFLWAPVLQSLAENGFPESLAALTVRLFRNGPFMKELQGNPGSDLLSAMAAGIPLVPTLRRLNRVRSELAKLDTPTAGNAGDVVSWQQFWSTEGSQLSDLRSAIHRVLSPAPHYRGPTKKAA